MAKQPATISQIISPVPRPEKDALKSLLTEVSTTGWFRPESGSGFSWPSRKGGIYIIYVNDAIMAELRKKQPNGRFSLVGGKERWSVPIGDKNVAFQLSGKKGGGGAADAKTTAAQERGSTYILQRVLKDNRRYNTSEDIRKDTVAYKELQKIWQQSQLEFDDEWLDDYHKQAKRMLLEYSNPRFTEFVRDGGFMDWVTKLVRTKYQISQKDNWNPADIWLIKDQTKTIKMIEDLIDGGTSQTLQEFNAILRQLFRDEIVVGVSLKKVSGKEAQWEKVNVRESDFDDYRKMYFTVSDMKIDLSLGKDNKGVTSFGTQDSRVFVDANKSVYNFQIKANDSAGFSNLKWEPTQQGAAAARLGKAPVDMVQKLMIDYGVRFDNKHGQYPKSPTDFDKEAESYATIIKDLKGKGVDTVVSVEKAVNNIMVVLGSKNAHVATSKLMQLKFLHVLVNMNEVERNKFMTDMSFLAQKKGERFGPFGKLY